MLMQESDRGSFLFWCPGCEMLHVINVYGERQPRWSFNGDMQSPTFKPSILVRYEYGPDENRRKIVCHSFIENGKWRYLNDCTHKLAGKTVQMVDLDEV